MRWIEVAPPGVDISIALSAAPSGSPRGVDTGIRIMATDVEQGQASMSTRRVDVDEVLRDMSREFDGLYAREGRPSIPPERLLRA